MKKRTLTIDEADDRFLDKLEDMYAETEDSCEMASYWWSRMVGDYPSVFGTGKLKIEVEPWQVAVLLRDHFEFVREEGILEELVRFLNLLCPTTKYDIVEADGKDAISEASFP